MQLTGKQIIERGIVTNYTQEAVQQQGVDVRVNNIYTLENCGVVPAAGKTKLPQTTLLQCLDGQYTLSPGYYEVELMEGIHMSNNTALVFKTRSSLVRCGAIVESGQFDAGFVTDRGGCFLIVHRPIIIDRGARIAQAIVHESAEVINTYDGQFQNDKQRDTK